MNVVVIDNAESLAGAERGWFGDGCVGVRDVPGVLPDDAPDAADAHSRASLGALGASSGPRGNPRRSSKLGSAIVIFCPKTICPASPFACDHEPCLFGVMSCHVGACPA